MKMGGAPWEWTMGIKVGGWRERERERERERVAIAMKWKEINRKKLRDEIKSRNSEREKVGGEYLKGFEINDKTVLLLDTKTKIRI